MNRIRQITFFAILSVPFILLETSSAQPSRAEAAKLFQPPAEQAQSDFSKIDGYVLGLKTKRKMTETELVALITQQSQTGMEKARAIFIWIADNIAYDTDYRITSKEEALKQGKGVCEAYSEMFKSFGELAGLEVMTIRGDSKQYFYRQPSDLDKGGHAWNAVKMDDGRWMIVDVAWGAGHVRNRIFTRKLSGHWFDPKPEIFIFTHFPKDDQWQLLSNPVTRGEFLRMPPLSPELVSWGFNPDATFSYFTNTMDASFPEVFSIDMTWKIGMMPVCSELKAGQSYDFELVLPQNEEAAIICNNRDWVRFRQDGNRFSVTFTPESKGQAVLAVKQPGGKFGGVFKYEVKK
ncbi:MAG: hypothetical protein LBL04_03055 [Bacteroidales bacterium]|jgi:hypothetical protein|nr:hypothetical protein [Bacteroidales bacterium]